MKQKVSVFEGYQRTEELEVPEDLIEVQVDYDHGEKVVNSHIDNADLSAVFHQGHLGIEELLTEFKGLCKKMAADENYREDIMLLEYWAKECESWELTEYQLMQY